MKNSKIRVIVWIISILTIFGFIACGSGSKTTQMRKVDISVSIPDSLQAKLLKMAQKPDVNITRVTLDVNSSSHIYMQDAPFSKDNTHWTITTDYLPMNEILTFTAKAYNSQNTIVFKGEYTGDINNQTVNITIPLVSNTPLIEQQPSLHSIVFNNHEKTDITFNVYNPNGDDLSYSIVAISEDGGHFNPDQGTLDFSETIKQIALHSTLTPPTTAGNYRYMFTLTNSDRESFNTIFSITVTPQNTISVYLYTPPIIDSVDSFAQENNLTVMVKAHDNSNNTLSYLWEKIDGSAMINSGTNGTNLSLTNYQPDSPVTLKVTVSNNKGSSVSRIFISDGATVVRSLELKGLYSENNKLYAINDDGKITLLQENTKTDVNVQKPIFTPTIIEGRAYFVAYDEIHGWELWKSDGTQSGTVMVKDINPNGNANIKSLTQIGNSLYFMANNGVDGYELWRSDGSQNGTIMVKDINPNGDGTSTSLIPINGILYFSANDNIHGYELWKSDGTNSGTIMVKDINSTDSSYPSNLTNVNGTLYFTIYCSSHTSELWKSDGTQSGTVMIKEINSPYDIQINNFIALDNNLYFNVFDGNGERLWKSDGTPEGTTPFTDYQMSAVAPIVANGKLFFAFGDILNDDNELWISNGTQSGTTIVKNINPSSSSSPYDLTNVNNMVYFRANDGTHGYELWKSNGTENGTVIVKDINPNGNSSPNYLTNIDGTLYFKAADETEYGLWKSNGTEIGTVKVTLPE